MVCTVFALYERNRPLAIFLLALATVEFLNGFVWGFLIPTAFVGGFCAFRQPPPGLVYLMSGRFS